MKFRFIVLLALFSLFACFSCTDEIIKPVGPCTFTEIIGNDTNPNTYLYQQILEDYVKKGIPGISIAIETPEHGWWVGCAGMACIEDAEVLEPCHLFHSASMGKPYTATMIMRLVEDEVIGLDDPISDYLSEEMINQIANGDVATIRHCLSHNAGFNDVTMSTGGRTVLLNNPQTNITLESNMENYFYGRPAIAAPGEKFHYSNAGFDLLGMIIEKASGKTIGKYCQDEIIGPLGLVNTYNKASPDYPDIDGLVNGYMEHYPGKIQNCSDLGRSISNSRLGAAGIIASPYEYARFFQELLRGNILEPATLNVMLTEHAEKEKSYNYCLGIMHDYLNDEDCYYHNGMTYGILAITGYFPDSDITFSILTNIDGIFNFANTGRFENLRKEIVNVTFTGSRE